MANKITVDDLNAIINGMFQKDFGKNVFTIKGEASNVKVSGQHLYMTLKDTISSISAVFWGYNNTDQEEITEGDSLIVEATVSHVPKFGKYQLVIRSIQREGCQGNLFQQYMDTKEKFTQLGYFNDVEKIAQPSRLNSLGVVTAKNGAAIKDLLYVLEKDGFKGTVHIRGTVVQGNDCPKDVETAIKELENMNVDCILVTRGGGSFEDLMGFSDERVIEAIHKCKIFTISAIGHEVDNMLSDYVADIRAPTPSIAGSIIAKIHRDGENTQLERLEMLYKTVMNNQMNGIEKNIEKYVQIIKLALIEQLDKEDKNLDGLYSIVKYSLYDHISKYISIVDRLRFEIMTPEYVLKRGYPLIMDNNAKIVNDGDINVGEKLKIKFKNTTYVIKIIKVVNE